MTPPTVVMSAVRPQPASSAPNSPASRLRGRRNAMADVTVGITADQLHTLEAMVQTFVPNFFNPTAAAGDGGRYDRRNAVANVVEGLSHDDLHHLEDMVRTYQPQMTTCHNSDEDSSSADGEDACYASAAGPEPTYYGRRRNAAANPLANLDCETLRRIRSLYNNRLRSLHSTRC